MNPRSKQYGLGGTVKGWVRLAEVTPAQRRRLHTAYNGINPMVYSRYGTRQWAAPLPWTRMIVKDPFALLSLPAIARTTGARPVVIFRHPGAVLSSYRRMGWTADLDEIDPIARQLHLRSPSGDTSDRIDDVAAMSSFWATLHRIALMDIDNVPDALVISHDDLAVGGLAALRVLFERCGLSWAPRVEEALRPTRTADSNGTARPSATTLHDFDRAPSEVAKAWRSHVEPAELETLDRIAGETLAELEGRRVHLA